MYEMLKEFVRPEFMAGIPILWVIGLWLKNSSVPNKHIPWVLGVCGIIGCAAWTAATMAAFDWQSVLLGICSSVAQGVLIAGASVYVHQVVKQAGKND